MISRADLVWNRAALEQGGKAPLVGDRHIVSLIVLHGMLMNGGLEHVMEALSREEYLAGVAAYRFLGLLDAADVLESALSASNIEPAENEYIRIVPSDAYIAECYERTFAESPQLFASL